MTDEQFDTLALRIAHRVCTAYRHNDEIRYKFSSMHLVEFVRALRKEWVEKLDPVAWMLEGTRLLEPHKFHPDCIPLYDLRGIKTGEV